MVMWDIYEDILEVELKSTIGTKNWIRISAIDEPFEDSLKIKHLWVASCKVKKGVIVKEQPLHIKSSRQPAARTFQWLLEACSSGRIQFSIALIPIG